MLFVHVIYFQLDQIQHYHSIYYIGNLLMEQQQKKSHQKCDYKPNTITIVETMHIDLRECAFW